MVNLHNSRGIYNSGVASFYAFADTPEGGLRDAEICWRSVFGNDYRIDGDCWVLGGLWGGSGCETRISRLAKGLAKTGQVSMEETLQLLEEMKRDSCLDYPGGMVHKNVLAMLDDELLKHGKDLDMVLAEGGE